MTNEQLNTALYKKMFVEQESYRKCFFRYNRRKCCSILSMESAGLLGTYFVPAKITVIKHPPIMHYRVIGRKWR